MYGETLTRRDLDLHQIGLIDFNKRVNKGANFVAMGGGKTISVLTAFADLLARFDVCRMLVIAPKAVAENVWAEQIQTWEHVRHLRHIYLDGSIQKISRTIQMRADDFDVWTVSCDKAHILARMWEGRRHPFDWLVIDESSRFKNQSSRRAKALKLVTINPERITLLTGTPHPNGLEDLWMQMYFLDRGARLGYSLKAYKDIYFRTAQKAALRTPLPPQQRMIQNKIADICYVLSEDEIDAVKPRSVTIKVPFDRERMTQYKDFQRDFILHLEGDKISAANAAALGRKLAQYTSGAIYNEDHVAREIHTLKLDALAEIVEDNPHTPILVGYGFVHEATRIAQRFPQAEIFDRSPEQIDRWNRGEIPMLLAHPKSAGHGLNLQFGGHIMVWFSIDYNLEEYQQMNKRLARKGQKHEVMIHHLIVPGTVDEIIMRSLRAKDGEQSSFQNALKKIILAVLASAGKENSQKMAA